MTQEPQQSPDRASCLDCPRTYAGPDTRDLARQHATERGHRVALSTGTHVDPGAHNIAGRGLRRPFPELKIWPGPYAAVRAGLKRYEVREEPDDWAPCPGDLFKLREWDPKTEEYTGRFSVAKILHVTDALPPSPLPAGLLVFGYGIVAHGEDEQVTWETGHHLEGER